MTITKKINGANLEIALKGRLDTMTAPELENDLNASLDAVNALTLDLTNLDYSFEDQVWDGYECSVLRQLADNIKIFIRGKEVHMIVAKQFA